MTEPTASSVLLLRARSQRSQRIAHSKSTSVTRKRSRSPWRPTHSTTSFVKNCIRWARWRRRCGAETRFCSLHRKAKQRACASGACRLQYPVFLPAVVVAQVGFHAPLVQLASFGAQQCQSCRAVAPPNFEMHFRAAACQQELPCLQEGATLKCTSVQPPVSKRPRTSRRARRSRFTSSSKFLAGHHLHVAVDTITTGHGSTRTLYLKA